MKSKLIVRNSRAFRNCFFFHNMKVEIGEDLLKREDNKVKEFIKKYSDYLFDVNYDKLKGFANYLQMIIARYYHIENENLTLYMDELGIFANRENEYAIKVSKNHIFKHYLTVHIYVDKIIKEDNSIYGMIDKKKKLIYQQNKEYDKSKYDGDRIRNILYNLTSEEKIHQWVLGTSEEQINKIMDLAPVPFLLNMDIKKIKQIECIYPFEDILMLTKDGLLVGTSIVFNNVAEICQLTSYRTYIIYKNGDIEFYTNTSLDGCTIKSKKVESMGGIFIAYLDYEKNLHITTTANHHLENDITFDNCIEFQVSDVEDFNYVGSYGQKEEHNLIIIGNKKKILLSLDMYVGK